MEISKIFCINADYKDRKTPLSWQMPLFAEVVLVDKTHDALHPMIYQLRDGIVPTPHQILYWKSGAVTLPNEAFILVGEALMIDKKKKQIQLANDNTIAYNYLIVAFGSKSIFSFESKKFLSAIQALIDAIRVKQKIPSSFAKCSPPVQKKVALPFFSVQYHHLPTSSQSNAIESIAQPHIYQAFDHRLFSPDLHTINKRLYEVHL